MGQSSWRNGKPAQWSIAMEATEPRPFPVIREAVASFPDREHFRRAVSAGLTEELKYIGPLTFTGIVLLSGGPLAATVAALVGAGLGGAALKEIFDDYTAPAHRDEFSAALNAGAALLWVRCADSDLEARAVRILEESGGRHVHIHGRPERTGEAG